MLTSPTCTLGGFKSLNLIAGLNSHDGQPISSKPILDNGGTQMSVIAEPVSMSWHNIDVFSRTSGGMSLPGRPKKREPPVHILKNGMTLFKDYLAN